jgi:hypothetical protein
MLSDVASNRAAVSPAGLSFAGFFDPFSQDVLG